MWKETAELESQSRMYRLYKGWEGVCGGHRDRTGSGEKEGSGFLQRSSGMYCCRVTATGHPSLLIISKKISFSALRSHPSGFIANIDLVLLDSSVRCRAGSTLCTPLDQGRAGNSL